MFAAAPFLLGCLRFLKALIVASVVASHVPRHQHGCQRLLVVWKVAMTYWRRRRNGLLHERRKSAEERLHRRNRHCKRRKRRCIVMLVMRFWHTSSVTGRRATFLFARRGGRAGCILSPGLIRLPLPRKLSLRRKQLGEVDLLLIAIADVADGAGLLVHALDLGLVAPAVHGVGAPAEISHLPVPSFG
uniref:Secreted protein n=1 Tax=Ixodes ricinus TaxID=34613 RepID=A0A6B0V173_IXORI